MIRRPPRSTLSSSSAASDVYKRQAVTHMLFGKLRVFSFYTDAGQFGAAQGQAAVVFGILALNVKNLKLKLFYTLVALAGIYGMMVSGTRGAIAVPIMGFALYL